MKTFTANTMFGIKHFTRRVGKQGWYYQEVASPSAPNGAWWLMHPQKGLIPIPSNSRALLAALADANER